MNIRNTTLLTLILTSAMLYPQSGGSPPILDREVRLNVANRDREIPKWSWGSLIYISSNHTASPEFQVFDRDGQLASTIHYGIEGSDRVNVLDWKRGRDGTLGVCGFAVDRDGRSAAFIGVISPDTKIAQTTRFDTYFPTRLAVAADGTIWTGGQSVDSGSHKPKAEGVSLRHFDRGGRALETIPQTEIQTTAVVYGMMASSLDRVGWYAAPSNNSPASYIEVTQGGTVHRFSALPSAPQTLLIGLALTDEGGAFLATQNRASPQKYVLHRLNVAQNTWQPTPAPVGFHVLYGSDRTSLVAGVKDFLTLGFFSVK